MADATAKTKQSVVSVVPSLPVWVGGLLALLVSVAATGALVADELGGAKLPGCGEGSGCAEATSGPWGDVPFTEFPVSIVGLGWFFGLTIAWLTCRKGIPAQLKLLIRVGALGSLFYIGVMATGGYLCRWCLAAHLGNFLLWGLAEFGTRSVMLGAGRALGALASVFVISVAGLGLINSQREAERTEQAQADQDESIREIIDQSGPGDPDADADDIVAVPDPETGEYAPDVHPWGERGFTGRWLYGPERAAIRFVMFSSYQCKRCKELEEQIKKLVDTRDDVSLSAMHFPLNSDCNPYATSRMHPNACWAARAAEAAGILDGNNGFWRMHFWLFDQGGGFTATELQQGCAETGFNFDQLATLMQNTERVDPLIEQDTHVANDLGIIQTPSIFINGVELRGWHLPNAIQDAVDRISATNPPLRTALADNPPRAQRKVIDDWLANRVLPEVVTENPRVLGDDDAPIHVVVYGDFQHDRTRELDRRLRQRHQENGDIRYEFRTFVFDGACNPAVKVAAQSEHGCRAAALAQAAAQLDAGAPYWQLHVWLMRHDGAYLDEDVRPVLEEAGYDADAVLALANEQKTRELIIKEANRGRASGARTIPTTFLNARRLPRWTHRDADYLDEMFEIAKEQDTASAPPTLPTGADDSAEESDELGG